MSKQHEVLPVNLVPGNVMNPGEERQFQGVAATSARPYWQNNTNTKVVGLSFAVSQMAAENTSREIVEDKRHWVNYFFSKRSTFREMDQEILNYVRSYMDASLYGLAFNNLALMNEDGQSKLLCHVCMENTITVTPNQLLPKLLPGCPNTFMTEGQWRKILEGSASEDEFARASKVAREVPYNVKVSVRSALLKEAKINPGALSLFLKVCEFKDVQELNDLLDQHSGSDFRLGRSRVDVKPLEYIQFLNSLSPKNKLIFLKSKHPLNQFVWQRFVKRDLFKAEIAEPFFKKQEIKAARVKKESATFDGLEHHGEDSQAMKEESRFQLTLEQYLALTGFDFPEEEFRKARGEELKRSDFERIDAVGLTLEDFIVLVTPYVKDMENPERFSENLSKVSVIIDSFFDYFMREPELLIQVFEGETKNEMLTALYQNCPAFFETVNFARKAAEIQRSRDNTSGVAYTGEGHYARASVQEYVPRKDGMHAEGGLQALNYDGLIESAKNSFAHATAKRDEARAALPEKMTQIPKIDKGKPKAKEAMRIENAKRQLEREAQSVGGLDAEFAIFEVVTALNLKHDVDEDVLMVLFMLKKFPNAGVKHLDGIKRILNAVLIDLSDHFSALEGKTIDNLLDKMDSIVKVLGGIKACGFFSEYLDQIQKQLDILSKIFDGVELNGGQKKRLFDFYQKLSDFAENKRQKFDIKFYSLRYATAPAQKIKLQKELIGMINVSVVRNDMATKQLFVLNLLTYSLKDLKGRVSDKAYRDESIELVELRGVLRGFSVSVESIQRDFESICKLVEENMPYVMLPDREQFNKELSELLCEIGCFQFDPKNVESARTAYAKTKGIDRPELTSALLKAQAEKAKKSGEHETYFVVSGEEDSLRQKLESEGEKPVLPKLKSSEEAKKYHQLLIEVAAKGDLELFGIFISAGIPYDYRVNGEAILNKLVKAAFYYHSNSEDKRISLIKGLVEDVLPKVSDQVKVDVFNDYLKDVIPVSWGDRKLQAQIGVLGLQLIKSVSEQRRSELFTRLVETCLKESTQSKNFELLTEVLKKHPELIDMTWVNAELDKATKDDKVDRVKCLLIVAESALSKGVSTANFQSDSSNAGGRPVLRRAQRHARQDEYTQDDAEMRSMAGMMEDVEQEAGVVKQGGVRRHALVDVDEDVAAESMRPVSASAVPGESEKQPVFQLTGLQQKTLVGLLARLQYCAGMEQLYPVMQTVSQHLPVGDRVVLPGASVRDGAAANPSLARLQAAHAAFEKEYNTKVAGAGGFNVGFIGRNVSSMPKVKQAPEGEGVSYEECLVFMCERGAHKAPIGPESGKRSREACEKLGWVVNGELTAAAPVAREQVSCYRQGQVLIKQTEEAVKTAEKAAAEAKKIAAGYGPDTEVAQQAVKAKGAAETARQGFDTQKNRIITSRDELSDLRGVIEGQSSDRLPGSGSGILGGASSASAALLAVKDAKTAAARAAASNTTHFTFGGGLGGIFRSRSNGQSSAAAQPEEHKPSA